MFFGLHVGIDAEHDFIAVHRCVGAEKAVPDGKNIAIIGVGVGQNVVVVYAVHTGCNEYPAEGPVEPGGELYVGVVELRERGRHRLVEHDDPPGRAGHYGAEGGKHKTEHAFARVVPVGRGGVDVRVGVVYEVETPHPAHFVLGPVYEVRADQVEQQQAEYHKEPQRHIGQPLQNAEMRRFGPQAGAHENKRQEKIDHHGGEGKKQVDHRVRPFVVFPAKQRYGAFNEPEKSNAAGQNSRPVRGGDVVEIVEKCVHVAIYRSWL